MTKLKQSLRNLVKTALLLKISFLFLIISGCSPAQRPDYTQEHAGQIIENTCKKEYNIDVKTKITGQTLWLYLPLEDIIEKSEKPEKYVERFEIKDVRTNFKEGAIKVAYSIKELPEQEKSHQVGYSKDAKRKINDVWKIIHRVLFSIKHSHVKGLQFFCFVIADIKNGFEVKQIVYIPDLKKISYGIISGKEFHHRTVTEDMNISFEIIGDSQGRHLEYKDTTLKDFIIRQIQQRIKQKFQQPEAEKNADIDKEIIKTTAYVLKIYNFKDFSAAEFNNTTTNENVTFGKTLLWKDFVN